MNNPLNSKQQTAVECIEGPLLVLAGAGSGKTRVVTQRIVHLLEVGVPASRILGVTFTNKAAAEMRERVARLTHSNVLICTFHSLGARILRESITAMGYRRDFNVYDTEDTEKLIKSCLKDLNKEDKKADVKAALQYISKAKNDLRNPAEAVHFDKDDIFPKIAQLYQAKLRENQAVDFDDLIYLPAQLFREHPAILHEYQNRWDFLLIDEYQDTNAAQYTLVNMLVQKHRNLCVVGDPDQSIYAWRGANINNILRFEQDYPGCSVIKLEQNYRSKSNIIEAANAVIEKNSRRFEKNLWSDRGPGEKIKIFAADDDREEAAFISARIKRHIEQGASYSDIVIFYRTHFQSRVLEDEFLNSRIPYVIIGGISFYQRREVKDILSFLRMVQSGSDFIAFARTINLPKRGIGDTTIEKLRLAAAKAHQGIFDYCIQLVSDEKPSEIRLTAKQKAGLTSYIRLIEDLRHLRDSNAPIRDIVIATIEGSDYLRLLAEEKETFTERKENLDSLIAKAVEWERGQENPDLALFLEELSLRSSADEAETSQTFISLMTIHNGKGLEFPITFVVGLEEDLFPHVNSRESEEAVEEERRLCYVAMTRAKDILYMTYSRNRLLWGTLRSQRKSRFITEVPSKYIEWIGRVSRIEEEDEYENEGLHYEPLEESPALKPGDRVIHADFGIGVIRSVINMDIGLAYRVFFEKSLSEKTLVAKYARLRRA